MNIKDTSKLSSHFDKVVKYKNNRAVFRCMLASMNGFEYGVEYIGTLDSKYNCFEIENMYGDKVKIKRKDKFFEYVRDM